VDVELSPEDEGEELTPLLAFWKLKKVMLKRD
jgi:hypothetical protein